MVMLKQVAEECSWGPHCPICKNEEEHKEDRDGNKQKEQPRMCPQNTQHPQSFDVPVRYSEQFQLRREWEEKIE